MNDRTTAAKIPLCSSPDIVPLNMDRIAAAVILFVQQLTEHSIPANPANLHNILKQYLVDSRYGFVLVAERPESGLVGVALCASFLGVEHGGPSGWLEELYVRPDSRGLGVGTLLLTHAISEAKRRGWRALDLEVEADHDQVVSLYKRHGFTLKTRSRYCLKLTANQAMAPAN